MVALNLTTTIDTVDHHHELNDIASSNLSSIAKQQIHANLQGRHT